MKTIEYRVQYTGATERRRGEFRDDGRSAPEVETIQVRTRDINSGYAKVLRLANVPLGNGVRREIGSIEFWQVTSW